jgi:hypothetical protein
MYVLDDEHLVVRELLKDKIEDLTDDVAIIKRENNELRRDLNWSCQKLIDQQSDDFTIKNATFIKSQL